MEQHSPLTFYSEFMKQNNILCYVGTAPLYPAPNGLDSEGGLKKIRQESVTLPELLVVWSGFLPGDQRPEDSSDSKGRNFSQ